MIPGTIQSPHAALVPPLFGRKKREKDRKIKSKNTASSSKQYYLLVYLFFLRTSRQKKAKIGGGTGEGTIYPYIPFVVPGIRTASRMLWTTTNNLEAVPAAKGRDNEGQMRRSHVYFFDLVATCDVPGTCSTQKTAAIFQPDPDGTTKKQISSFGDPQTGEV